jgi:hypothetical protein
MHLAALSFVGSFLPGALARGTHINCTAPSCLPSCYVSVVLLGLQVMRKPLERPQTAQQLNDAMRRCTCVQLPDEDPAWITWILVPRIRKRFRSSNFTIHVCGSNV